MGVPTRKTGKDAENLLVAWIKQHPDKVAGRDLSEDKLHEPFIALLEKYPETLEYDFPLLKELEKTEYIRFMHIAESKDKRLRANSWDTNTGGTWSIDDCLWQYKYNGKVTTIHGGLKRLFNPKSKKSGQAWIREIHDLKASSGETYYLIVSTQSYSGSIYSVFVDLCKITDKGVVQVKGFTENYKPTGSISVGIDLQENPDFKPRDEVIFYEKAQTLKMPIQKGEKILGVAYYHFDGEKFVVEKNKK